MWITLPIEILTIVQHIVGVYVVFKIVNRTNNKSIKIKVKEETNNSLNDQINKW